MTLDPALQEGWCGVRTIALLAEQWHTLRPTHAYKPVAHVHCSQSSGTRMKSR
jgi:hypothetical protein